MPYHSFAKIRGGGGRITGWGRIDGTLGYYLDYMVFTVITHPHVYMYMYLDYMVYHDKLHAHIVDTISHRGTSIVYICTYHGRFSIR